MCSYNCKNLKTSVTELQTLCGKCDLLLLQETWIIDQEIPILSGIHKDFYSRGISSIDTSSGIHRGRPYGGLAILWRKTLGSMCSVSLMDDSRLMAIEIKIDGITMTILNVYMPYDNGNNIEEYQSYLVKVDSKLSENHYACAMRDFNANVLSDTHRFGTELINYCDSERLVISDKELAPTNTFTFLSEAHSTVSWIDHIVSTVNMHGIISQVWVDNAYISSDHFPMFMRLNIKKINLSTCKVRDHNKGRRINWSRVSSDDIKTYVDNTERILSGIRPNHNLLVYDNINCCDPSHTCSIERMYGDIVDALQTAGNFLTVQKQKSFKQIPGWNEVCMNLHHEARESFLMWKANGKPRTGPIHELMKISKTKFKYGLRQCKKDAASHVSNKLAHSLLTKDSKAFWKGIKSISNKDEYVTIADTIDGITGPENITEMWRQKYKTLLNSSKSCQASHQRNTITVTEDRIWLTSHEITDAINKLKKDKSPGRDNITGEHIQYSHPKLSVMLTLMFNSMIQHGYVPEAFMDTLILPIVKDTKEDLGDSDNYRPIALTSVISKVFELVILERCRSILDTSPHQFGFKAKHGTELSIFALKQVIEYYITNSSNVYLCYIDLSKAFDRIEHDTLFRKLRERKISLLIVRLLENWYKSQKFYIQWGSFISAPFNVTNGVRQGGIMSPVLFNVYIDDLTQDFALCALWMLHQ